MQRVVDWLTLNFNKDESIGILKENQALQRYLLICAQTYDSTPIESSLSRMQITASRIFVEVTRKSWGSKIGKNLANGLAPPSSTVVLMVDEGDSQAEAPDSLGAPVSLGSGPGGSKGSWVGAVQVMVENVADITEGLDHVLRERVVDWLTLNFNKDESIGILKENQALQRYLLICAQTYDSTPIESSLIRMQITASRIFDEVTRKSWGSKIGKNLANKLERSWWDAIDESTSGERGKEKRTVLLGRLFWRFRDLRLSLSVGLSAAVIYGGSDGR
ncbi:hypothetical protein F2Q70_00015653 [Brassica cretica]|uniref:Uncharacterized protein n=1 Tax=Brassica cretica TaxID=69181 RepID=A0A8S9I4V1_BRACR|nr:hypothetical protein F2Q70_00015653 [Brassica cretica]